MHKLKFDFKVIFKALFYIIKIYAFTLGYFLNKTLMRIGYIHETCVKLNLVINKDFPPPHGIMCVVR